VKHVGFALVLGLASGCAATPPRVATFQPSDRAAIEAVMNGLTAAWNRNDLTGFMEGYAHSPALVFTSGGQVRRGWQDAFDHYKARYAKDPTSMGKLAFKLESIDPVGADGAVVLGDWDLRDIAQARARRVLAGARAPARGLAHHPRPHLERALGQRGAQVLHVAPTPRVRMCRFEAPAWRSRCQCAASQTFHRSAPTERVSARACSVQS
jgi:ketosteroid isomerase-like protein